MLKEQLLPGAQPKSTMPCLLALVNVCHRAEPKVKLSGDLYFSPMTIERVTNAVIQREKPLGVTSPLTSWKGMRWWDVEHKKWTGGGRPMDFEFRFWPWAEAKFPHNSCCLRLLLWGRGWLERPPKSRGCNSIYTKALGALKCQEAAQTFACSSPATFSEGY